MNIFENNPAEYIKIQIKPEDIDEAKRGSISKCPIARALNRITNKTCSVSSKDAFIFDSEYQLSEEGKKFVNNFDVSGVAAPCVLELKRVK